MLRFVATTLGIPAFAVSVFLLAADSASQDAGAASNIAGDVNCSGTVDAVDALQVLRSVAGLGTNAGCLNDAGDVDCNGDVNSVDALKMLRYVAGLANQYPDGCTPIGEQRVSSDQLIGQALESGEITEEEATVYQVLAAFGDSRLPDEYHGAPSDRPDSDAAMIAAAQFADLSAAAQNTLRPFLTPPYAPGSWLHLPTVGGAAAAEPTINPTEWTTFDAAEGKVKVWARNIYPGELAKAPLVAAAITDTIWPSLIALMGEEHAPLSDAGYPNDGGDGALDVYLVTIEEKGTFGQAIPYIEIPQGKTGPCEMSPVYIHVDGGEPLGSATEPGILSTTAHEIFHAFQLSFDLYTNCYYPEYKWFMEASATWAEDYVYPAANAEHLHASNYLWRPHASLDNTGLLAFGHDYGSYLLPFYVARKFGSTGLVRTVWEGFSTADSLPAINTALAPYGGFETLWPEFVLYNWNREESQVHYYYDWDGLEEGADVGSDSMLMLYPGGGSRIEKLEGKFNYLSARYYHVTFPLWNVFPERSVTLKNTLVGQPHMNVQGMVRIGGDLWTGGAWQEPEDWTSKEEVTFCRDEDETKRMQEMIIIVSNSGWETMQDVTPAVTPTLEGSEIGCTRWIGDALMTYRGTDGYGTYDRTAFATDLVFEPVEAPAGAAHPINFELKSGVLTWKATVKRYCTVEMTATVPVTQDGHGSLTVSPAASYRGYAESHVTASGSCDVGAVTETYNYDIVEPWFRTDTPWEFSDDSGHLTGAYSFQDTSGLSGTYEFIWDLRAAPAEPTPTPAVPP